VSIVENSDNVFIDGDVMVNTYYSWEEVTLQYVLDDHFFCPMDEGIFLLELGIMLSPTSKHHTEYNSTPEQN